MQKITNENKKIIEEKLEYIGLNLSKIPKFLTEFESKWYKFLFTC